jgi:hypothetical protein
MLRRTTLCQANLGAKINQPNVYMKLALRHAQAAYRDKEIPVALFILDPVLILR